MTGELVIAKPRIYGNIQNRVQKDNIKTYHRRHVLCLLPKLCQLVPSINMWAVQQDVQDGMGSTGVVAELVREPHAICSGVIKIRRTMGVAPPHEAEYQAVGSEMIDGPGLDVVELDELESMNAESAGKGGEYRWVRFDNGEGPANEVVLLRLLWLLFIDLHVEQLRVVAVCTRCSPMPRASSRFLSFCCQTHCAIDPFFTLLVFTSCGIR
jgi:hypothetical protein